MELLCYVDRVHHPYHLAIQVWSINHCGSLCIIARINVVIYDEDKTVINLLWCMLSCCPLFSLQSKYAANYNP